MSTASDRTVDRFDPIDLPTLDRTARLHTRKDRKYVIDAETLAALVAALPTQTRVLEIDGRRWFGYRSVYFDTPHYDSYRQAATGRPRRFKVRTRSYLDADVTMLEVKTKDRRGRTVKHRRQLGRRVDGAALAATRAFAAGFAESSSFADELRPVLTSHYRRATLVPADGVRVTIDADYGCTDVAGRSTGLCGRFIVETKSAGPPTCVDRLLWRAGVRPLKISKYATGLAALHPELPANRWHRALCAQFGRAAATRADLPPADDSALFRHRRCDGADSATSDNRDLRLQASSTVVKSGGQLTSQLLRSRR